MTTSEPKPAPAAASEADAWFTSKRFSLVLGGLIALSFARVLAGSVTFWFHDFGLFGYPLAYYHRQCFWRGELPLWNPYNFCGLPFLAQWNTLTLYPPSLFYLIFPLSWSLGVFNLAHLFLAGLGMYRLTRHWTGNSLAASAAGLLFAFNGLTWHSLMWPNDIAGLAWMPWVVLMVERAWREGGRVVFKAALVGAMQMLSGAPEVILLTWGLLAAMWLGHFIQGKITAKLLTLRAAAVVTLVAGLAAAQLLPFLELLKQSHRDAGFGTSVGWAMPLSGIANFFAPLFHHFASSQSIFVQYDQYWAPSFYLGMGAMLLAALALWRAGSRRIWLLAVLGALTVWMSLGLNGHLYTHALRILPSLGFMRYPVKFMILPVFLIPILAAYGMRHIESSAEKTPASKSFLVPGGLLLGVLALLAWLEWEYPNEKDNWNSIWQNIALRGVFAVLIIITLFGLRSRSPLGRSIGIRLIFLSLLWLDVLTHQPNLSPVVTPTIYEPGMIRAVLKLPPQGSPGDSRFMETDDDVEKIHMRSLANPVQDYLCRRVALFDNCNLLDDIPKTDGFYSLYIKDTVQLLSLVYGSDDHHVDLPGLKDFISIGHISTSATGNDKTLDWVERTNCLPLITAGQKPLFVPDTNALAGLLDPAFNGREIVYLPPESDSAILARRTTATIISPEIGTQKLKFEVESPAPAMVVVAQSWYRPWHAYVDGKRVTLWHANHAFQALEVPAGHHTVRLNYEDSLFAIGVVISLASLGLVGAGWYRGCSQPAA